MNQDVNLLMVEDDETDAELIRIALQAGGLKLDWRRVDSEAALRAALADGRWDVIISDFAIPGFSGLRAFEIYRGLAMDVPFIFVSGALGEERAVEAMRAGAKDYIVKGNLARLSAVVKRELKAATDRVAQRTAEERARREQQRLALAMEATQAGVFELNLHGSGSAEYSGAWDRILGKGATLPRNGLDLFEVLRELVHPEERDRWTADLWRFGRSSEDRWAGMGRLRNDRGEWVDVSIFVRAVERSPEGLLRRAAGVVLDRSHERLLEAQLRQAQKMEAVGQLAGGVAHDFNNLLTAILSFSAFALEELPADAPANNDIREAIKAAQRAQSLTAQLLAFSRRKAIVPRVLNANRAVEGTERMLGRLLGADVELVTTLASGLWNVRIDPDAFEQVLLNLAVNARDAMPQGGRLVIETANLTITENDLRDGEDAEACPPGEYVSIAVRDSGTGMDAATQGRIFEPFFTTKEAGKGTGLGLSTCYGIVRQAEGRILVRSALGVGTTFTVILPRVERAIDEVARTIDPQALNGGETILVAEDDPQVRSLAVRILANRGYDVLQAADGAEALRVFEAAGRPISLVVTDLVMPSIGGTKLVEHLQQRGQAPRVLYMSGYAAGTFGNGGAAEAGSHVLQKPFTPISLATKVRQVLDS